jgi:NADH:ubiquinone oxidoreductase subunit E
VVEAMAKHIGVDPAGGTSDDLEHTLDTVACIGCCSLAPVVTIDDEIHGKLDQQQAVELLADVILDEEAP